MSKPPRIVLCGLGNVGKAFVELVAQRGGCFVEGPDQCLRIECFDDTGGTL